jgi:hypothetical protein
MAEITASLRDAADHFRGTAELLDVSAQGAQEAQDLVEQIVRELIATNAVTQKAIVQPTLGGPIKKVTGADKGIEWPQVL